MGAIAQEKAADKASAVAPTSGPRAEFLNELKGEEEKFIRLAGAIPADKYTWRPGPDVRSIAEVFLHVAAANYNLPHLIGTAPPEGFQAKGFDKSTTDKAKGIQALQDSFAHLRQAVIKVPDADLEKQLDWFGGSKNTERGILLFIMRHMGEHLGQSIAYARMNGVVPPWTEDQQKQAKPDAKPKQ
ncbi:MAG TPA: DinB family protein [Terriglobales bacterium]|nr:DinB family protein [Terriglobales bacterium]